MINNLFEGFENKETFLLTANHQGHIEATPISFMEVLNDSKIRIKEWFTYPILANLRDNYYVTLLIWDTLHSDGFQIQGHCQDIEEIAILDGMTPLEKSRHYPQGQWQLDIHINDIHQLRMEKHHASASH
jgi:hypothetical protein